MRMSAPAATMANRLVSAADREFGLKLIALATLAARATVKTNPNPIPGSVNQSGSQKNSASRAASATSIQPRIAKPARFMARYAAGCAGGSSSPQQSRNTLQNESLKLPARHPLDLSQIPDQSSAIANSTSG